MHLDVLERECLVAGAVLGDSVRPKEPEVSGPEGDTVTLSCSYETSYTAGVYLFWYRQYPNRAPQYILQRGAKGITFSDTAGDDLYRCSMCGKSFVVKQGLKFLIQFSVPDSETGWRFALLPSSANGL
ncbi:cathepsin D-like [Platysternon megacephalum]|uniref:Cathepsin D-like n=1 Tax=Platysternon megacephalum TaxID=55544 RepID=A0A4D9DJQ4_9SAUR|nr:cathepsin D-like [Platysternon megacephalum]